MKYSIISINDDDIDNKKCMFSEGTENAIVKINFDIFVENILIFLFYSEYKCFFFFYETL